jgi:hypothetical protein
MIGKEFFRNFSSISVAEIAFLAAIGMLLEY